MWVMPFWEVSRLTYPPHVIPTHPLIHPPIISKIAYQLELITFVTIIAN